mmetsp:Transcript_39394/g.117936  ORF Transcript_39394/g.117936 Transcript_39394/m.117936 type:complete len:296 (-) Transcript_39394:127-1014(-)
MGQCGSMCPAYGADGPCGLDPAECLAKHPRSVPSAGAVSMGDEAQECSYSESSPGRANAVVMRQSGAAKEIPPSAVMRLTPEVLAAIWQELSMCPVDGIPHNSGTPAPPPGPAHHDPDYWRRRPKADALGGRKRHKGLPVIPGHYAQVTLHVYDTSWLAAKTGVPAFHVGVEVLGTEFSFGDMGINCNRPGEYDSTRYRRAVPLGRTDLQDQEILKVLRELQMEWPGEAYRLNGHNCQTFAEVFCKRLGLSNTIPEEYLAFARPWSVSVMRWGAAQLRREPAKEEPKPRSTKLSL